MELSSSSVAGAARAAFRAPLLPRLFVSAALLLGFSGAALAQTITFAPGFISGQSGNTLVFNIETRDAFGSPAGGGSLNWLIDPGCNGLVSLPTAPATADPSGTTAASVTSQQAVSCQISVQWDHDNNAGTAPITAGSPLFLQIDPLLSMNVISGPGPVVPIGELVDYQVQFLDNGFPVGANAHAMRINVSINGTTPLFFGDICGGGPHFFTDAGGVASFGFDEVIGLLPLQAGTYSLQFDPEPIGCFKSARQSRAVASATANFVAEPVSFAFAPEAPIQITVDAGLQDFPLTLKTVNGTPVANAQITWTAGPSGVVQPISGNTQTDGSGTAIIQIEATATDLSGASISATWQPSDGVTSPLNTFTNFTTIAFLMALETPPPATSWTDETSPGFSVKTLSNSGNTDDPVAGVPVTFTILTGNATFSNGSASTVVNSGPDGVALSLPVVVGRTDQSVDISANAGVHGTLTGIYLTTRSIYQVDWVDPTSGSDSIFVGASRTLTVALARQGSSTTAVPLGAGESVSWSVSPNDGSSIDANSTSDTAGQASSVFTPAQPTTYTITASFDPGITGVAPSQRVFSVDATIGAALLVSKTASLISDGGTLGFADQGDVIEYLVTIENTGGADAAITQVVDSLQGGPATTLSGCPTALPAGTSGSCSAYSYVVQAGDMLGSFINNTATATADFGALGVLVESASAQVPVAAASPFTLSIVSPVGGAAQISVNLPLDLVVLAEESGLPVTDGRQVLYTIVSGPAGGSLSTASASTLGGEASSSFSATQAGTYLIDAELDLAVLLLGQTKASGNAKQTGAVMANPKVSFTIDVIDPVRTLTKPPVDSGDGQTGTPGSSLPNPLLVFARDNGVAAQGVTVNWTVQGDATLSANQTTTLADGSTSVIATLGQSSGSVQVTATRADDPTAQASFVLFSVAKTLSVVSGNNQSGNSGETLPLPLVVEAHDEGVVVAGTAIQWYVVSGDASLSDLQTATGADGRTSISVTLGQGGPVQIQAFRTDAPSVTVDFSLSSQAVAESLEKVSGDGQTGTLTRDGEALSVRFLRDGNAVAGQAVTWQVVQGDATLSSQSSSTDASGLASTLPRFGTTAGSIVVRASAGNAVPVDFLLQAAAPELRLISGGGQSGPSGTRAAQALVVGLFDACCDAPIADEVIIWQVIAGDASLDAQSGATNLQGQAENSLTFGSAGSVVIRASALNGLVSVDIAGSSFTASISAVSGDGQTGFVEMPLDEDFVIRISQTAATKLLGDITIDWQVIEGGGSLAAHSTLTDADGFAANRLTLGPNPGINRVQASFANGGVIVFTATGELPVGTLVLVSGDGQTLPTNTDSAPLVVELRDGNGDPIANRTLVWSGENAELQTESSVTNSQGRAQNVARVLIPGAASVQVSNGQAGASGISFVLNGGIANIPTLSPGQRQVARAMDSACELLSALSGALSAEQADLLARCLELANSSGDDPQAVQEALSELSNDIGAAQVNAAFDALRGQFGNIQRRLATRRNETKGGFDISGLGLQAGNGVLSLGLLGASEDPTSEVGADFGRWSFFASGMLGSGRHDPTADSRGFKSESSGLTAGVDYRVNPQIFVGAAIGYNRQDSDFRNDRGGMDTSGLSITGYASWYNDKNWYVDGVLTLGRNDYQVSRHINYTIAALGGGTTVVNQTARGKTSGDLSSLSVSAGRDFQSGAWSYGSYLRGSLARADIDAYSERITGSGAGTGLGLAVDSRSFDSQTATLGGRLSYTSSRDWGILTPNLQFEWEHELKDDAQRVVSRFIHDPGNTSVVVDGDPLDRSYFNVGLGLSAIFPGGRSAFVFYEQLMGRSGQSQGTLSLGVRIEF